MRLHLVSDEDRSSDRPKLGLGYLASYLKKNLPGTKLSLSFAQDDYLSDIEKTKPELVGFSAMTHAFSSQIEKAKKVKKKFDLPIIFGGVHVSLVPQALPQWVEAGVISEGEETLLRLLKYFKKTGKLQTTKIPALIYWQNNQLKITGPAHLVEPIDRIPSPDWDFLQIGKKGPGHIMTSRGCPFHCRFCEAGKFWKKYRLHSPQYVVQEIETIYRRYGRDELVIMDDLFFIDKARIERIKDLLVKKKLTQKMRFEVIGRADLFSEETARILSEMNVFAISFGMESGSEKILRYLKNDTVTLAQIRKAVKLAKRYQMQVLGTFMVGSPGETENDVLKTIDFIKDLKIDQVGINVTTPFPGTELWEVAKKKGLVKDNQWDERLWAMRDVNEKNINEKLLLTEIPKRKFLRLMKKMFILQDWTHRRRRNEQFFRELANHPGLVGLIKFLAHSLKRPKEAVYNFNHGYFRRY